MRILVSACLLGLPCRYDGKSKPCDRVIALAERHELVPFCPEIYGGLPTPRVPAERAGDRVINRAGVDVTENYRSGARQALELAKMLDCKAAILKEKSPSCGSGLIYDGTFSGVLVPGDGVTVELLKENGIAVYGETQGDFF